MINKKTLPLRTGVGVVVLNNNNKVFVGKRKDNPIDKWQMPQGGVNNNENFLNAMKRELDEETSIKNIKILKELDGWYEYELPKNLLGIIWKGRFRGQCMHDAKTKQRTRNTKCGTCSDHMARQIYLPWKIIPKINIVCTSFTRKRHTFR